MDEPEIVFSPWVRWHERTALQNIDHSGVYMLAHFDEVPADAAKPCDQHIVYIGETCGSMLRKRWRQFNRAAFDGLFGHSGGITYRRVFNDQGTALYVAAFPIINVGEPHHSNFIQYAERKLLWQFVQRWNVAPQCNSK